MKPRRIDHVALWVANREAETRRILDLFAVQVLEREAEFTLLGSDRMLGKVTLFDADGPREQSQLMHVAFRVPGRGEARDDDVSDALHLYRVEAPQVPAADLDHVALRVADPEASVPPWLELGFQRAEPRIEPSARLELGGSYLELYPGTPLPTERPVLNHVGLLVESIDPYVEGSSGISLALLEVVDAEHSRSVFVQGPDEVRIELIEHKPSFTGSPPVEATLRSP